MSLTDANVGASGDTALAIAVQLIAEFEGFRSEPYQDVAGVWTIGFGFTYQPDGKPVSKDTAAVTRADAETRLAGQAARVLGAVRAMVHVPITNNQAAAMCSFAFNEGTGALRNSQLLLHLNQGKPAEAADCFRAWIYAGGQPSQGLRNRREREREVFLTPDVVATESSEADRLDDLYNPPMPV